MWDVSLIIGMALPYIILSCILVFIDVRVDGATLKEKLNVKIAEHHNPHGKSNHFLVHAMDIP